MSDNEIVVTFILIGLGVIFAAVIIRDLMRYAKEYDRLFDEGKDN